MNGKKSLNTPQISKSMQIIFTHVSKKINNFESFDPVGSG